MGILGWDKLPSDDVGLLERAVVSNVAPSHPRSIEIQPTNKCNVACFFCSSEQFRHDEFLPWERLEETLRVAAANGLRSVRLSGGGESLVYPRLGSLLDLLEELGVRLSNVTTNATPLARCAEQIVRIGTDEVSISLNEPNAERYAAVMRTTERSFHKAVEGTEALVAARDAVSPDRRPVIELKLMFWKENFRLGREMLALGRKLGADKIMINMLYGLAPGERLDAAELEEARGILREMIAEDCATGDPRLHFHLEDEGDLQDVAMNEVERLAPGRFRREEQDLGESRRIRYCMMGWYHATIAATGKVYPCCNFVGLPDKVMGDLHAETLEEIWNGAPYEKFRREFRQLMLLGGDVEHSRKYLQYLEPMCIAENACPFSWGLCSADFYKRVADGLAREAGAGERLHARARNGALRAAHRAKAALGR